MSDMSVIVSKNQVNNATKVALEKADEIGKNLGHKLNDQISGLMRLRIDYSLDGNKAGLAKTEELLKEFNLLARNHAHDFAVDKIWITNFFYSMSGHSKQLVTESLAEYIFEQLNRPDFYSKVFIETTKVFAKELGVYRRMMFEVKDMQKWLVELTSELRG